MLSLSKSALAVVLLTTASLATAATYAFRVYTKGVKEPALSVSLAANTLPNGKLNRPYNNGMGFDLQTLLTLTGQSPNVSEVTWELTAGHLPLGLSLSTEGVIAGTPGALSSGDNFTVTASYRDRTGQQSYTIEVGAAVLDARQIAARSGISCAVTTTGGAKCWGANNAGQLGDGTTTDKSVPVDVIGLTSGVSSIAVGAGGACALTTSGEVKCWGMNNTGQLGDGTTTNRATPATVSGLNGGVARLFAGGSHFCVMLSAGGVKCWGFNTSGQLGDGTTTNQLVPVDIPGLATGISTLSLGSTFSCALTTDGGVKCWGANNAGQLGDRTTTPHLVPGDFVSGLSSNVTSIASNGGATCAVTTSGGVKCWGDNTYGQMGDGTTTTKLTPVDAFGLTSGVSKVTMGGYSACAIAASGVKCWGLNDYGQLGVGSTGNRYYPSDVVGLPSSVSSLALGHRHTCATLSNRDVMCWGLNNTGQVGDGTTTSRTAPVNVQD